MTIRLDTIHVGRAQVLTSASHRDKRIYLFFLIQLIGVTFAQKFALPIGDDLGISLSLPLMAVGITVLLVAGDVKIPIDRALSFAAFATAALASQTMVDFPISIAGLFLFLIICVFWIFQIELDQQEFKKILLIFQHIMSVACVIALFQNAWQYIFGWTDFFNIELFVPSWVLFPGFVYIQPLYYGSPIMKPAGLFLEVSFLSQAIAVALVIEATCFRSVPRLCLLGLGIVSTYAGTGPLTLLVVLPLLLGTLPRKLMVAGFLLLASVLMFAALSGSLDAVFSRAGEFSTPNSSASQRFIRPLEVFPTYFESKIWLFTGIGAGNIEKAPNVVWWAMNKVFCEYGFITLVLYYVYLSTALFASNANKTLAVTLFVIFNFMGGYVSNPPMALLLMLLGTLPRIRDNRQPLGPIAASIRVGRDGGRSH